MTFKVGDKVQIIATPQQMEARSIPPKQARLLTGKVGTIKYQLATAWREDDLRWRVRVEVEPDVKMGFWYYTNAMLRSWPPPPPEEGEI